MTVAQLDSMEVMVPAALVAQAEGASTPAGLGSEIGKTFGLLYAAVGQAGLVLSGAPRAIYTAWSPDEVRFTVAVPIDRRPTTPLSNNVDVAELPAGKALRFVHLGPYRDIRATYDRIESWLRDRGAIRTPADWARYSPMWEEYLNDPATTPESELVTHIFLPLHDA